MLENFERKGEKLKKTESPPAYESVLVMVPDMSQEQQKAFFKKIKEIILQFKGSVYHADSWGLRKLANHNRKGHSQGLYFHFSFTGQAGVIAELTRVIKMQDQSVYHHFEKLHPRFSLKEHLEHFRQGVENSLKKEKERLSRIQQRKKMAPSFDRRPDDRRSDDRRDSRRSERT